MPWMRGRGEQVAMFKRLSNTAERKAEQFPRHAFSAFSSLPRASRQPRVTRCTMLCLDDNM
jgi:hypothetical protein